MKATRPEAGKCCFASSGLAIIRMSKWSTQNPVGVSAGLCQ